jgi:hypothetical protein
MKRKKSSSTLDSDDDKSSDDDFENPPKKRKPYKSERVSNTLSVPPGTDGEASESDDEGKMNEGFDIRPVVNPSLSTPFEFNSLPSDAKFLFRASNSNFMKKSDAFSAVDVPTSTIESRHSGYASGRKKNDPLGTKFDIKKEDLQQLRKDTLKDMVERQGPVHKSRIHQLNRNEVGGEYNAFRVFLLDDHQLTHLAKKIYNKTYVQPDGCIIKKRKRSQSDVKEPSGVYPESAYAYGFMSPVLLDPSDSTSKESRGLNKFKKPQIALYAFGKYPSNSEEEASHRCHNPFCLNPRHLHWESQAKNMNRQPCVWIRSVQLPGVTEPVNACRHKPQCVPCTCPSPDDRRVLDYQR